MSVKGRKVRNPATHCRKGHELTPENTRPKLYAYSNCIGRVCKACERLSKQKDPEEHRRKQREWGKRNPQARKKHRLKTQYGISLEQYESMVEDQSGRCAICNDYMGVPCVDHSHATNKVRALLCTLCNTGIGQLRDDPKVVAKALEYLLKHAGG